MFGFKFDEDKIKVAIDIYKEEHGIQIIQKKSINLKGLSGIMLKS